jgi:hypothetical protein
MRETLIVGSALLVGLWGAPVLAQSETKAREFMRKVIGFTAADFGQLDSGKVVTRQIEAKDKGEVAAFGATKVNAASAVLFEKVRSIETFRRVPEILEIGVFSNPPKVQDLAGLTFPEDDVEALRKCRPGKCDVKLSTAFIERLAKEVDWSKPGAADKAVALAKQGMIEFVTAYQTGGTEALGVVADKANPKSRVDEYNALLANSPYFLDYVPDFFDYLRDYPKLENPEMKDAFYWTKDNFGLKPVISIYHVTTQRIGDRALLAQKTLYASHYFNAGLEFWAVAAPPSGTGFELLMLYRTRLDPPTGMLAGVLMGKIKSGVETGVRENLKNAKAKTEAK